MAPDLLEPRSRSIGRRVRRVDEADLSMLLRQGNGVARFAWSDGEETRLALGAAAVLTAKGPDRAARIRSAAHDLFDVLETDEDASDPSLPARLYGGFAFHPEHEPTGRWAAFPSAHFVLPAREYVWKDSSVWEVRHETDEPAAAATPATSPSPRDTDPDKEYERWRQAVDRVRHQIEEGELTKVVLARAERHAARHDAAEVFDRLCTQSDPTFRFLVEPVAGHAFYGATPELLLRLRGQRLETAAVAGSIGRGSGPAEDAALGRLLQSNPKDSLEHEIVVSYLLERLGNLHADDIAHRARRLLKLSNVQHLLTPIDAKVPEGTHALDLVDRLHPTPAVGGIPREASLRVLQDLESFRRGWYAGVVGWFDANGDAAFATAIRSALTTTHATWLFAGAGIVAGSEPEAEWRETQLKMRLMAQALGEDRT